jgi:hypothetical protein
VATSSVCGVVSIISLELNVMPSRFARSLRGCNGENDASAQEPINSLLSSYGALPGGSNPQRKECEAAIN